LAGRTLLVRCPAEATGAQVKPRDAIYIAGTVAKEGFESAFVDYSDFADIQDAEFHEKRKAYLDNRKALVEYLGLEDEVST
jgi:hypothetical protein